VTRYVGTHIVMQKNDAISEHLTPSVLDRPPKLSVSVGLGDLEVHTTGWVNFVCI
jgi:hypothetical protein